MDILYKNKLLVWATLVLLAINIGALTTFWVASKDHDKNNNPGKYRNGRIDDGILVDELKLTNEQIGFYKNAKKLHFKEIRDLRDKIETNQRLIREELFSENPDTARMNQLSDSIGLLNAQFEKANSNHFLTLKTRLSEAQCKKFQILMDEVSNRHDRDDRRHDRDTRVQHRKEMK